MLKKILLLMAKNRKFRNFLHNQMPFLSRRYTAGKNLDDAIAAARGINMEGMKVTINKLGETVKGKEHSQKIIEEYLHMIKLINEKNILADISIKPTNLGILIDHNLFKSNLEKIVEEAEKKDVFVWVDMEEPDLVHSTIRIFEELHLKHKNIGICLQSYLQRTDEDIENLISRNARIRMVKGVYLMPDESTIHDKNIVRERMLKFSVMLLKNKNNHAIATHDEEIIKFIKQVAKRYDIDKHSFEFQFLYGRKKKLQKKLAEEGYKLNVYLPYGGSWINYYLRRLEERV